jgi:hypothetical protein|tara:strand:- start:3491 stop:3718 length:228 start_codon:yes stop_codon:yes gene_type:complete
MNKEIFDAIDSTTRMLEAQSDYCTKAAESFMEIMKDYMARQDDDSFDANEELYDLYTDLSNLYYNIINEQEQRAV